MLKRVIELPVRQHILLFGPRGVGKSTWLRHCFNEQHSIWINLLKAADENRFARNPMSWLPLLVLCLPRKNSW